MKYLLAVIAVLSSACASAGVSNGTSSNRTSSRGNCTAEFKYIGVTQGSSYTLPPGQMIYGTHFTVQQGYYMSYTQEEAKFVGRTGDRTYAFEITRRERRTGGGPASEETTPVSVYSEDETKPVHIGAIVALLHSNGGEPRIDVQFTPSNERRAC